MKSWFIIAIFSAIVMVSALAPQPAAAEDTSQNYVSNINYSLEQPFGGVSSVSGFPAYLQLVYQFALGIVGIIATVLIMFGGVRWISAAGNESIIGEAKEIIIAAVTGLIIALLSYVILLVINPQLINISFNLKKIAVSSDSKLWTYPKCSDSPFTGQTCTASDQSSGKCETLACGLSASYNNKPCRATFCAAGAGICSHDPTRPKDKATCEPLDCGTRIDAAAKLSDDPNSAVYKNYLCSYYTEIAMPWFGAKDPKAYDANQQSLLGGLCGETISQTNWLAIAAIAPFSTFLTAGGVSASQAQTKTYNCGFSCTTSVTSSAPSGYYAAALSAASAVSPYAAAFSVYSYASATTTFACIPK